MNKYISMYFVIVVIYTYNLETYYENINMPKGTLIFHGSRTLIA